MDKIFISNQIKYDILTTGGFPADQPYNLHANTPLNAIGYNSDEKRCRILEERLRKVAQEYNTGRNVIDGDISEKLTVRECIQLVIA